MNISKFQYLTLNQFQGLSNGVENDQNSLNLLHEPRLSASTASTHSHESDYAVPNNKHNNYPDEHYYKNNNPLFGVNAASHYAPAPINDATETKHYEKQIPNGVRKAPEGQDNEAYAIEEVDGRKELVVSPNQIALTDGGTATYTTDNNGKINVHVTVMINAGNYVHPYRMSALTCVFAPLIRRRCLTVGGEARGFIMM